MFSSDLGILFIPTVRSHHYLYSVVTGSLDIVVRMFNINYIEIRNNNKIGTGFICFIGDLKSFPYLITDILGDTVIRTGK